MIRPRFVIIIWFVFLLIGCSSFTPENTSAENSCLRTEPMWLKPPEDAAVPHPPTYGYYFVNEDQSIWASAWQAKDEENPFRAGEEGNKVGWFRPAGAELEITGRRLDAEAPPLEAEAGCCYPTRFQASGVYFPTEGCWEVNAQANDRKLSFVIWVEP
ncbi:MAG TPA: hypothetical protein VFR47_10845 [Anaerolineales bacterium]|nr:hypothetical protein [Anaerolineales bacterium]